MEEKKWDRLNHEFDNALLKAEKEGYWEKKRYKEICLTIWGCIPTDVNWAINTNIYQEEKLKHGT